MEQPQGDSELDALQRLENYFTTEQEAPAPEAEEAVEAQTEEVASEQPEETAEETQEDAGLVELELEDGQTYKVPPALKDGYLRHSDYTKKTQEVAMLQKQTQAVMQQQALYAQFQEQTREDQQQLAQVQAELNRFKQLDWTGLDTDTILKTRIHIDTLKDRAQELEKGLNQKAQQAQQKHSQLRAEAARNAYDFISRHVKDWTPDSGTEREVATYASAYGIAPEALAEVSVMYPGFAVLAHKAAQYDKLQSSKSTAIQKAQKAPPVIKPGAVTSTNSAAAQKARDLQGRFKKSGDTNDFAALLLARGMVK